MQPIRSTIRPVSSAEAVEIALRDQIVSGEIPPGTRLPEEGLATSFGVTRPTAHEAVQALLRDGLLRRERNRTAYVPQLTTQDVRDLFIVRTALELHAITVLIERGVRPAAAERAHERLEGHSSELPWTEVVEAALGFHRGLIEAVESPRMTRTFASLEAELKLCFGQVKQARGELPAHRTVAHGRILDAIVKRKTEQAVQMMREHLEDGARMTLEPSPDG